MGYRNYLFKIEKDKVKEIRNLTLEELKNKYQSESDDDYISIHNLIGKDCIFEFGKLYWDDTIERINATGEKLFTNNEVQEYFCEYDSHLVGKDALKVAIEIYKNKIKEMYRELNKEVEKAKTFEDKYELYKRHIKNYECEWFACEPIQLDKNGVCCSWLYEHLIFELVHLYKTIDFDRYVLVFLGW